MKHQQICEPQSGKLVRHPLGRVPFACDIHLGLSKYHCKHITKD